MKMLPLILVILALIIISILQIINPEKVMLFGFKWLFEGKADVGTSMKTMARIRGTLGVIFFSAILIKILTDIAI